MAAKGKSEGGGGIADTLAFGGAAVATVGIMSQDHGTGAIVGGLGVLASAAGFGLKIARLR